MKNKKIRTSPLTLPEHFGALKPVPNWEQQKSQQGISWPWVLGTALILMGGALLILPRVAPKYVTKEDALAESLKNDERHLRYQRQHSLSIAKVKHEIRKTQRRQNLLKRRIDELEDLI